MFTFNAGDNGFESGLEHLNFFQSLRHTQSCQCFSQNPLIRSCMHADKIVRKHLIG